MGNKSSSSLSTEETAATDGNSTITRAIARGRVYLVIRYPRSLEDAEENFFNTSNYRDIMRDLQQVRSGGQYDYTDENYYYKRKLHDYTEENYLFIYSYIFMMFRFWVAVYIMLTYADNLKILCN